MVENRPLFIHSSVVPTQVEETLIDEEKVNNTMEKTLLLLLEKVVVAMATGTG